MRVLQEDIASFSYEFLKNQLIATILLLRIKGCQLLLIQ